MAKYVSPIADPPYTAELADLILGKRVRGEWLWPYGVGLDRPESHANVDSYLRSAVRTQEHQGALLDWAQSNGLRHDGRVLCCLNWLMRKAGTCSGCQGLPVTRDNGTYWRTPGDKLAFGRSPRTLPAAIALRVSDRAHADLLAQVHSQVLAVADGPDWGTGPQIILYRRDLLPDFMPTVTPVV